MNSGRMLKGREKKESLIVTVLMFIALAIYVLSSFYFNQEIKREVLCIFSLFIFAGVARYILFVFRLNKGCYGNNEAECRELLKEVENFKKGKEEINDQKD